MDRILGLQNDGTYTEFPTDILMDKTISLTAKGLFIQMCMLADVNGIVVDPFESSKRTKAETNALKELMDSGYVRKDVVDNVVPPWAYYVITPSEAG